MGSELCRLYLREGTGMSSRSTRVFKSLFNPESIVVIGASNDPSKPGGRVTKNIKENGYRGSLWTVNPKAASIQDLPTFKTIEALPGPPDLALIAIPAPFVQSTLEALARKGARASMILTAGFGEKDEKGKEEEIRFLDIAGRAGMTLVGPNCSGFLTTNYAGKFAGLIPKVKKGVVDFISGSGATVDWVMEQATTRGLSFSNVVNMGNSIQIGVEDILALVDENFGPDSARIILLYMELVKKPAKLLKHARSLTGKGCNLVGIKSGVTEAGKRAAASHTGAMATTDAAVQALFDKTGIIRVRSRMELTDVACALTATRGPIKGNRVCVVTDAGGPGVMLADELNRHGLVLPLFNDKTGKRLSELLPPESAVSNPVDCLPSRDAVQIKQIFNILAEEEKENIDVMIVLLGNSGLSDNWEIYLEILDGIERCPIPIIPVLSSGTTCAHLIGRFRKMGKVYFSDEVAVGQALGKVIQRPLIYEGGPEPKGYDKDKIKAVLDKSKGPLTPEEVRKVLTAAGFGLPFQEEVFEEGKLRAACEKTGFPLAIKVIGPLHKSDVGGVKIGVGSMEEAEAAWTELLKIEAATGVLVQGMVPGTEVILGAKREEGFGPLIMFGLGGIYTEALKDVSFALAPLGKEEGMRMIRKIKSFPVLEGIRGEKGVSLDLLSEYLVRLGLLASDFPEIEEIDLNPVKGFGTDLYVVDARIIQGI